MKWVYDDGGRKAARFKGSTGDCFTRAISIVTEIPYRDVYRMVNDYAKDERYKRGPIGMMHLFKAGSSARDGVLKHTANRIIDSLNFIWTPCMKIGQGCRVHLRDGELPMGRLVVQVSKHYVAVLDGIIHDTHDPSRDGTRCVYGYWTLSK